MGRPRAFDVGAVFGRLIVLEREKGNGYSLCKCECGNSTRVHSGNLISGRTKSCGCLEQESREAPSKHGHARANTVGVSRTYRIWKGMKDRCSNPNSKIWPYYGGRGISVCPRWRDSFENFLADMGEVPDELSIDRINPDGDYEPSNCRWATRLEQRHNRSQKPRGYKITTMRKEKENA